MENLDSDKFYFAVECGKCGLLIGSEEAPSPDEVPNPTHRSQTLKCSKCGHEQLYTGNQFKVVQGPDE